MTDKQPKALRLADAVCDYTRWGCETPEAATLRRQKTHKEAAAELRRLHEVNAELVEALRLMNIECQHLHHAKKDQHGYDVACLVVERIKASIAKATGEQQ
jgi:hypothetical protein